METQTEITQSTIPEQKESIKLTKNAKGEYQWEIKVLCNNQSDEISFVECARLKVINDKLEADYGSYKQ